jgi:hypothetical protein
MFPMRKNHEFVRVIALLVACTFPNARTAWHTTSLEPKRFSAEKSPPKVRLTLSDGTRFTAKHPVVVGDSVVWAAGSDAAPRDSARSAVLASNIRKVEVHGVDAGRTIGLLVVVGGVVGGTIAILYSIAASID